MCDLWLSGKYDSLKRIKEI